MNNYKASPQREHTCAVCCLVAVTNASGVNMPPTQKLLFASSAPPPRRPAAYRVDSARVRAARSETHSPRLTAGRAAYCDRQETGTLPLRRLSISSRRSFVAFVSPLQYALWYEGKREKERMRIKFTVCWRQSGGVLLHSNHGHT